MIQIFYLISFCVTWITALCLFYALFSKDDVFGFDDI